MDFEFAQVILPLNVKGTFTYQIPLDWVDSIKVGNRVLIPFGGKKIFTGIVAELHQDRPLDFIPKEIISVLDKIPIVPIQQIQFWKWIAEYYLCNIGEIYRFAFPSSLKLESQTYIKLDEKRSFSWENLDTNETLLVQTLEVRKILSLQDIEAFIPKKEIIKAINKLIDLKIISIDEKIFEKYKPKTISYIRIKEELFTSENLVKTLLFLDKAKKQKELFLYILSRQKESENGFVRKSTVLETGIFSSFQLKALKDKDLIEEFYKEIDRIRSYEGKTEAIESLTDEQEKANQEIDHFFKENKNVLLHGVTSSGKTHIYFRKIEETISRGKTVLLLLPEVSLTKQIIQRLEKKYGKIVGFYHTKLSDFEKVEIWKKIRNEKIKILIGTRQALFLPFQNIGLIIVDEEHDYSYKPKEITPYFNAKDAAVVLAQNYGARLILGSATPSIETYYAAQKGKLGLVKLQNRYNGTAMPTYEIIDFREAQRTKSTEGNFSKLMIEEITTSLKNQHQVIILHNRRGYASTLECKNCGYAMYCQRCDVVMTYHKHSHEMKCHYCGQKAARLTHCPSCHEKTLREKGIGVEQIHEEVEKIFAGASVDRMDADSMRRKFAYEKLYEKIETGKTNIIVGTQMISKGLNFDKIECIAIPKADNLLHITDFRAEERAYQLITQIAGRAGRVSGNGKVLIQTYQPENPIYCLIKEKNSTDIYQYFLKERKKFLYPPYVKLILVELKHRKEDKAHRASLFFSSVLKKYLPEECILGPEQSPIPKINNLYQYEILLKLPATKKYIEYKKWVKKSVDEFHEIVAYKTITLNLFVDF